MIRFLGVFLLFNLFATAAMAQNSTIRGTVNDATDKIPVPGATVVIFLQRDSSRAGKTSTVTDAKRKI